jgi:beta-glucosidase
VLEPEASANSKFYWGAATAAYQVEGSPLADGSGSCVWHEFSHTPGCTYQGQTGDVANDHYHRWPQDIDLMEQLGLNAYRFSIRWPRVLPEGKGALNPAGLSFYDKIVDKLLEKDIEPFITLFHWDLPSALHRLGGWTNPDIAGWFADYATVMGEALGDRVKNWMTLNEPFVVSEQGHLVGNHAPGMRNIFATASSVHHQIRAHVAGYHALKAVVPQASVGIAMHDAAVWPATESDEDVAAAERAQSWHNFPLFGDPLVLGHYPPALEECFAPFFPKGYEDDLESMQVPPDFIGLNYYQGYKARHSDANWLGFEQVPEPDMPTTTMLDWIIRPEGLHRIIMQAHERYKLPAIYITENGASFDDVVDDGAVHDAERTSYLKSHIAAVLQARDEGVPVQGYFVWSFMDNFEWGLGFSKRFGIVRVDYETQERTIKDSGHWYSRLARTGVIPED